MTIPDNTPRFFLVFATNMKGEQGYLREWLEYHLLVGVEHFYLYDQDDNPETIALLEPYEQAGLVTRHPWTHYDGTRYDGPTHCYQKNKNHLAFAHCARHYRNQCAWMMKIDVDEFLYPLDEQLSVLPWLHTIDRRHVKGLRIPRFNFGDNGHRTRPPALVIQAYTRREATASNHKDMANAAFLSKNTFCYSAHWWRYKPWKFGRLLQPAEAIGMRINHYYTKSFEEYRTRQNVSRGRGQSEADFIRRNQGCHAIEDAGMLRFVPEVRRRLASR